MIPTFLIEKIKNRAYEIYLYRMEHDIYFYIDDNGKEVPITADNDWKDATDEVLHQVEKEWG